MIKGLFASISLFTFLLWGGNGSPAPAIVATEKVIVVQLDVQFPAQSEKCYTSSFDKKKIELNVAFDDTINFLPDFIFEEDAIEGPDCFMPQMKLIFKDYTYVVSLYCTSVLKYKNSAPYIPSASKLSNDLEITESVLTYLKKLHSKYFGLPINLTPAVCQRFLKTSSLLDEKDDDIDLGDEEEDDNSDLEKDVHDNQGLFDNESDPGDGIEVIEPDDE